MPSSLVFAVVITVSAFVAALVGLMALAIFDDWRRARGFRGAQAGRHEPYVFLFDGRDLIDASPPARVLLRHLPGGPDDWIRLIAFLSPRFAGLSDALDTAPGAGGREFRANDGSTLELAGGPDLPLRLTLVPGDGPEADLRVDTLCQNAQELELSLLRDILDTLPFPLWRTDDAGGVTWVNSAYVSVVSDRSGCAPQDLPWPLPDLLDDAPSPADETPRRVALSGQPNRWFQIHSDRSTGAGQHVAVPCDALVRAETTRDEMMQTLAKTFADLPIGLAVFDRQRQLALFNPALCDLTELGPEFLMTRPAFHSFFDRLRDSRMIPEPRDYHGWRHAIADIEKAAATGHYEDTWNLPSGATYRVTARPHPDGAIALWFEDVSADMSLARRFRAEVQTCQAVFDHLDTAVAVFSPAGVMTLSNAAFTDIWGFDGSATASPVDAADLAALWQAQTEPSQIWDELVRYLSELGGREPWSAEVRRISGQRVVLRAHPLQGGSTMVQFRAEATNSSCHVKDRPGRIATPAI